MEKYYRHFKGGLYRLIGIAKDSETLEEVVVYQAMYGDRQMWVRPAEMFFGKVDKDGKEIDRFQELVDVDDQFQAAARLVVETQSAVRANLQRKLALGYERAGRILEQLEDAGIVGPMIGDQPREVLVQEVGDLYPILARYESHLKSIGNEPARLSMKKIVDELFWDYEMKTRR